MSHECPECGQICYCNGDIEDMENQDVENYINCNHWKKCEGENEEDQSWDEGPPHLVSQEVD